MPDERVTQVKMADGTIAPVEYLIDESQWPPEVRRLAKSAAEAGKHAIQELLDSGIPAVFMEENKLMRLYPDGHKEVISEDVKG